MIDPQWNRLWWAAFLTLFTIIILGLLIGCDVPRCDVHGAEGVGCSHG